MWPMVRMALEDLLVLTTNWAPHPNEDGGLLNPWTTIPLGYTTLDIESKNELDMNQRKNEKDRHSDFGQQTMAIPTNTSRNNTCITVEMTHTSIVKVLNRRRNEPALLLLLSARKQRRCKKVKKYC